MLDAVLVIFKIMKYLLYFRPGRELRTLITSQNHVFLPGSGLHATLCFFYMSSEDEAALISDLLRVEFSPFTVETEDFADFDKDSLVLRLSLPRELLRLHTTLVSLVSTYATEEFAELRERYFGECYNPHLTISRSSSGFDRSSRILLGRRELVSSYSLARKKEGVWEDVGVFYSLN